MIEETSGQGNILVEKCAVGEVSFGEMSVGEESIGEVSVEDLPLGKRHSGNCPIGKLSYNALQVFVHVSIARQELLSEIYREKNDAKDIFHLQITCIPFPNAQRLRSITEKYHCNHSRDSIPVKTQGTL